jgi:hypothetical protein
LLVVSSSPSVIGETGELENALDVLVRFIDVTVGGVLESEIEWAPRLAESRRLAEYTECIFEYEQHRAELCPADNCDPVAVCSGDFAKVCRPADDAASDDEQDAASGDKKEVVERSTFELTRDASELVAPIFQMTSIYRDEFLVPGLPGYVFRSTDQRKLFLAGAEEARLRCFEIARLLGIDNPSPSLKKKLLKWCTPSLEPLATLCADYPASEALRPCDEPLPDIEWEDASCP